MNKSSARDSGDDGHPDFLIRGIGPLNPRTGVLELRVGQYMEMQIVNIPRDGQKGGKLKLVKLSNDLLHQAYKLRLPIAGVASVLGSLVEERGLYLDSIGEFFQLYGRFEQMLRLADNYSQEQIKLEMNARLGDDVVEHSREYMRGESKSLTPLPLYVRNVLTHQGTNRANVLGDGDVTTAIRLLRNWLDQE